MQTENQKKKILVVDDELESRIFLSTLLQNGGFEAIKASNASEGLQMAQEANPCLIILDVMGAGTRGTRLYSTLKLDEKLKNIPVIMLSSVAPKTFFHYQQIRNSEPGFQVPEPEAFLEKPPEADDLLNCVHLLTQTDSTISVENRSTNDSNKPVKTEIRKKRKEQACP